LVATDNHNMCEKINEKTLSWSYHGMEYDNQPIIKWITNVIAYHENKRWCKRL